MIPQNVRHVIVAKSLSLIPVPGLWHLNVLETLCKESEMFFYSV